MAPGEFFDLLYWRKKVILDIPSVNNEGEMMTFQEYNTKCDIMPFPRGYLETQPSFIPHYFVGLAGK